MLGLFNTDRFASEMSAVTRVIVILRHKTNRKIAHTPLLMNLSLLSMDTYIAILETTGVLGLLNTLKLNNKYRTQRRKALVKPRCRTLMGCCALYVAVTNS